MTYFTALLALIAAGCYAFWKLYIKPYPPMPSTDHLSEVILNPRDLQVPAQPQKQPVVPSSKLHTFCTAIMNFEGGPNDPNHKNCNPGDFRCSSVGYLPKYGKVRCSPGGFAIFPTFELGWLYLEESVKARIHLHPNWTFLDFFTNYAPENDGNPTLLYAETVAKECGVDVHSKVSDYLA